MPNIVPLCIYTYAAIVFAILSALLDANSLLLRGTIFGTKKTPNSGRNWMCRRRFKE